MVEPSLINVDENNAPEWILFETDNSFTLQPNSILCVQTSLTIDKLSLKATEHGNNTLTNIYRYLVTSKLPF